MMDNFLHFVDDAYPFPDLFLNEGLDKVDDGVYQGRHVYDVHFL